MDNRSVFTDILVSWLHTTHFIYLLYLESDTTLRWFAVQWVRESLRLNQIKHFWATSFNKCIGLHWSCCIQYVHSVRNFQCFVHGSRRMYTLKNIDTNENSLVAVIFLMELIMKNNWQPHQACTMRSQNVLT